MGKTLEKHTEIERSIIKKFRKTIWNNFIGAVKEYELIAPGECCLQNAFSSCSAIAKYPLRPSIL